jgi:hypothetical protein
MELNGSVFSKKLWQIVLPIALLHFYVIKSQGQDLYKTPSGEKYHLASCRMVVNISKKLVNNDDLANYNLQPCKIYNPPARPSWLLLSAYQPVQTRTHPK